MSRLNSKLVLKALPEVSGDDDRKFEIVKSVNTLAHGVPGDILDHTAVIKIVASAENRGPRNQLTVEFIK